ncbi:MAG TPA: molybdopterin-synthase adenylyltransferase MoeB [Gemmatimonadales bacterium]|nr:molybdopterin-synthase adenylyltransferase MoeB [Gemmatimonadales bacterium]
MTRLSQDELVRYARHLSLPHVGRDGQERLKAARVLIVGAGGLGSPAALYLAAAGVGTLGLVDADRVDLGNLQRQILHDTPGVGVPKVESGRDRIANLNPLVRVETHPVRLHAANAAEILAPYDVIVDGSDNFPTRYLVNDTCVWLGKPLVYGSIFRFEGQVSVFHAPAGPCYRCLYAEPPPPELVPNCAEGGVLGVLPGIIGTVQALEAIKLVLGIGTTLLGRLLVFDALDLAFRELQLRRDPACPVCGDDPTITEPIDYEQFCGFESSTVEHDTEVTPVALAAEFAAGPGPALLDVREPWEWEIARIDGSRLVPLGDLPARLEQLDARTPIVTICHHGARSAQARDFLKAAGFGGVRSLSGGIDEWARTVAPGMARY